MDKAEKLKELHQQIDNDKSLPLRSGATQLVFGEGDPDSQIYFLGEAPGFYEDQQGKPFVGAAGKLLEQLLATIDLNRQQVYISNIVRFRPPGNRDPLPEEIAAFAPYVDQEIEIIKPKLIVTLGRFSMNKFLPNTKISQIHGQSKWVNWKGQQTLVIPMFHPAAALRADNVMQMLKADFLKIPELMSLIKPDKKQPEEIKIAPVADDRPKQLELI